MSSTTAQEVSLTDAAAQLTELVRLAQQGTDVIIVEDGLPVARLVAPGYRNRPRVAGLNEGEVWMSDDFDAELSDEFWFGKGGQDLCAVPSPTHLVTGSRPGI